MMQSTRRSLSQSIPKWRICALFVAPLVLVSAAPPASLPLQVIDQAGMPVGDAVIEIARPVGDARAIAFRWRSAMAQKDLAFAPGTLIVGRGASVAFPNLDTVRHSIYSFSKPGPFKIDLYGRDQTRAQRFDVAGTVALGCNIHDQMRGYIRIVSTPYAAKSDTNGLAEIDGLPQGSYDITVWHPRLKGAGSEWRGRIVATPGKRTRIVVPVRGAGLR
ncbi:MAG: carboxypeptidase regulatory-like domain-containing protein [Novosphingobium sp.]